MNSKRVACGLSCLTVIANRACIIILFVTHGLRLSNFDGGRNNGKPYFYSAKSMIIRIHAIATLGNRKIVFLARTRVQFVRSATSASSNTAGRGWLSCSYVSSETRVSVLLNSKWKGLLEHQGLHIAYVHAREATMVALHAGI